MPLEMSVCLLLMGMIDEGLSMSIPREGERDEKEKANARYLVGWKEAASRTTAFPAGIVIVCRVGIITITDITLSTCDVQHSSRSLPRLRLGCWYCWNQG